MPENDSFIGDMTAVAESKEANEDKVEKTVEAAKADREKAKEEREKTREDAKKLLTERLKAAAKSHNSGKGHVRDANNNEDRD